MKREKDVIDGFYKPKFVSEKKDICPKDQHCYCLFSTDSHEVCCNCDHRMKA